MALHASAVDAGGRAVLFLAANRGGKSTLAAASMAAGHALLSDDIVALEASPERFVARPSYPEMRMWPETAKRLLVDWESLAPVHQMFDKLRVPVGSGGFGRFGHQNLPVACIYVPDRQEDEHPGRIEIQPLRHRRALIELVRCSFSPHLVQAAGLQPGRLDTFARLVREVPVRRLSYPSGIDRLSEVTTAVFADLEGL